MLEAGAPEGSETEISGSGEGQTTAPWREGLGLLERVGLGDGGREMGNTADARLCPSLGEAEQLGPGALVAQEALDALALADQGAPVRPGLAGRLV
jgi:hypothetical protein